jgi:hypothetical protein
MQKPKVLVVAGNTREHLDDVRVLTNVFTGNTGKNIAVHMNSEFEVTLLLSNGATPPEETFHKLFRFEDHADLSNKLKDMIQNNAYDMIVMAAAVSDYTPIQITQDFRTEIKMSAKIKTPADTIQVTFKKTPKIIDQFRAWGFKGMLVKFKLEVGVTDFELMKIGIESMEQSQADILVANRAVRNDGNTATETESEVMVLSKGNLAYQMMHRDKLGSHLSYVLSEKLGYKSIRTQINEAAFAEINKEILERDCQYWNEYVWTHFMVNHCHCQESTSDSTTKRSKAKQDERDGETLSVYATQLLQHNPDKVKQYPPVEFDEDKARELMSYYLTTYQQMRRELDERVKSTPPRKLKERWTPELEAFVVGDPSSMSDEAKQDHYELTKLLELELLESKIQAQILNQKIRMNILRRR